MSICLPVFPNLIRKLCRDLRNFKVTDPQDIRVHIFLPRLQQPEGSLQHTRGIRISASRLCEEFEQARPLLSDINRMDGYGESYQKAIPMLPVRHFQKFYQQAVGNLFRRARHAAGSIQTDYHRTFLPGRFGFQAPGGLHNL